MARPRKADLQPLSPLEAARTKLTTQIEGGGDRWSVVKVHATLQTDTLLREAVAVLETQGTAEAYVRDMKSRLMQGMDPLSGMDPVAAAHFTGRGECDHQVGTPHFVLAGIASGL